MYSNLAARPKGEQILIAVAALWMAAVIGLAAYHTWQFYTPYPEWDMWDGYLGNHEDIFGGDWSAWWAQHNEHRLFLSRLLFFADISWFGGRSVFLLIANYILLALLAGLLQHIAAERLGEQRATTAGILLRLFIVAWLFLLCQGENLTWAFQGQFFFAYLFPLAGLYLLRQQPAKGFTAAFAGACACGLLAAGAMANGVIALPLMAGFALVTRQGLLRFGILTLLSALVAVLYFHHYSSPGGHSLISAEVARRLGEIALFVLALLGNPFPYLLAAPQNLVIAQAFGALLVVIAAIKTIAILRRPNKDLLQTAMLFFLAYTVAASVAAALGRFYFGPNQALTPHYTTPTLLSWTSVIVLYAPEITRFATRGWKLVAVPLLILAVLMVNLQKDSLSRRDEHYYDMKTAILGLALGIDDQLKTQTLTAPEFFRTIPPIAERAYANGHSIFGAYPFVGERQKLGSETEAPPAALPACQAEFEALETTTDKRFDRVRGWIIGPAKGALPEAIRIFDGRKEIGYGIVGRAHPHLVATLGPDAAHAGFDGYIFSKAAGDRPVVFQAETASGPLCRTEIAIPDRPFFVNADTPVLDRVTVNTNDVLPGETWTGGDSYHTNLCKFGLRAYGSVIDGDRDTGSIRLRVKPKDRLLYRSGPTGGHQILEIEGKPPILLPVSVEWITLEFPISPDTQDRVTIKFTDEDRLGRMVGHWRARRCLPGSTALGAPIQEVEHDLIAKPLTLLRIML